MTDVYNDSLQLLNPEQREAVEHIEGPVSVSAGPGTGKTQILTLRIAHIIQTLGADTADSVLALTFTNSAVRSMRDRLATFTDYETAYRVPLFTFHSFAQHLISAYPDYFKERAQYRIASDIERIELLQEILEKDIEFGVLKPLFDTNFYLKDILFSLDKIKTEGYTPEEYAKKIETSYLSSLEDESLYYKRDSKFGKKGEIKKAELAKLDARKLKNEELVDIYIRYQAALIKNNYFDYSDLILTVLHEFDTNDSFKQDVQEQYQYILVDEHQDTNDGQNRFLAHLLDNPVWEGKPNIFTVGDAKQSIFRFAGATQDSFKALEKHVSELKHISLKTNYRSGQHILDQAYSTITESEHHAQEETLQSFFKHDGVMELRNFTNYKYELAFIAESIKSKLESGVDPNEIAVLYRKNYYAEDIRTIFDLYSIPYRDYSKKNLLDDVHMKKLFLLFKSCISFNADQYLAKLLYSDFVRIHPFSVSKILQKVRSNRKDERKNIYAIISDKKTLQSLDIPTEEINTVLSFANFLAEAHAKSHNEQFIHIFSFIVRESGFLEYLLKLPNNAQALASLDTLFNEVKRESFAKEEYTLADFDSYITVMKEYKLSIEIPTEHRDGVSLLTFHGSKGLEFEDVYLYKAVETRKVPQKITLSLDLADGSYEDERRLLFVALTRAKKNVYISYPEVDYQDKGQSLISFLREQALIQEISTKEFEENSVLPVITMLQEPDEVTLSLLDPQYITKRFTSRGLSVSALNNFIDSPVLYFFRNLVLLPEAMSDVLEFGNCIHRVLEDFFKISMHTKEVGTKEDLLDVYKDVSQEIQRWSKYKVQAEALLREYWDEYHGSMVVPQEVEYGVFGVEFTLDSGATIQLAGRIDKIEEDKDGNIIVVDYKTGKSYSEKKGKNKEDTQKKKDAITRQAVFYALLLESYRGGRYATRNVVFDFVQRNTSGVFEKYEVVVTDEQLLNLKEEINTMADSILSGQFIRDVYSTQDIDDSYKELFDILLSKE